MERLDSLADHDKISDPKSSKDTFHCHGLVGKESHREVKSFPLWIGSSPFSEVVNCGIVYSC